MDEPHATNAQVAQLASELQRRLSQLTSTWTAAPVEVHRLQETVVRVSTILQSSVQRQSEPALELEAVVGSTRHQVTANERLGKNLLLMSRLLEEVNEILWVSPLGNVAYRRLDWLKESACVGCDHCLSPLASPAALRIHDHNEHNFAEREQISTLASCAFRSSREFSADQSKNVGSSSCQMMHVKYRQSSM